MLSQVKTQRVDAFIKQAVQFCRPPTGYKGFTVSFYRSVAIGVSALAISVASYSAQAANLVQNGGFETTAHPTKGQFQTVQPAFWNCSTCGGNRKYTYVDGPGQATNSVGGYPVYGGAAFPTTSPQGGNFIQANGDSNFRASISQMISGLVIGTNYNLSFYQAAGQQIGRTGATTEQWRVTLGTDLAKVSPLMKNPSQQFQPWQRVNMSFTATKITELLTFLSVGTPNRMPPTLFLDGVDIEVPEPAALSVMGVGILGLGAAVRRRRAEPVAGV